MEKDISQIVSELNAESYELLVTKNKDYSNDNLVHTGAKGISARLVDKAQRLFNLSDKRTINHESMQDSILDLINYAHLLNIQQKGGLTQTTKMAFLSGPIDDVAEHEAQTWREALGRHLLRKGVNTFDPSRAFNIANGLSSEAVIAINKEAIRQSDIIIVNLSGNGRAFGTIREIEYAKSLNKHVVIVGEIVSLAGYDCVILPSIRELYEYLGIAIPQSAEKGSEIDGTNQSRNSATQKGIKNAKKDSHSKTD